MATVNWSLQHKRDTAANWTSNNPTLLEGQLGIETDNLTTTPKFKIGDGVTDWNTLPYFYGGAASAQNLNNVLSVGNTTNGNNIVMSGTDVISDSTGTNMFVDLNATTIYSTDGYNRMAFTADISGKTSEISVRDYSVITLEKGYVRAGITDIYSGVISQSTGWYNQIHTNLSHIEVQSNWANFRGIEYLNDWSANYSLRSLVDKGYVINNFVPYTGATSDVDLGAYLLSTRSIRVTGTAGSGDIHLRHQSADATATGQSTSLFADVNGNIKYKNDGNYYTTLKTSNNTGDRIYTYPDADGTIALTSNIGTWGALNYPTWVSGTPFVKMTAAGTFALDTNTYLTTGSAASTYLTIANAASTYQPLASNLTSLSGLTYASTSFVKMTAAGTFALDTNTYLTTSAAASTYQPLDADLTSWASVTRASGFDTFTATPSSANLRALLTDENGTGAALFDGATSPTFTTDITTPLIIGGSAVGSNITYKSTSGAGTATVAAHTFTGGTNGGTTIATLYNNGNFSIGNYASPNNLRLVTIGQDTAYMSFGSLIGTTSSWAFYGNQATPSATNPWAYGTSTDTFINAGSSAGNVYLQSGGNTLLRVAVDRFVAQGGAQTSGAQTNFTFTVPANTGQTASTEIPNFKVTGATKTWATGAITTQRWNYFTANTAAFASASTITNSYGLYVEAATAGTNATITNNWGIGFTGGLFKNSIGNTVLSNAALSTSATDGFLYIPTSAGAPTGVPKSFTGVVAMQYDTTNNKLYIYNGGWKSVTLV